MGSFALDGVKLFHNGKQIDLHFRSFWDLRHDSGKETRARRVFRKTLNVMNGASALDR